MSAASDIPTPVTIGGTENDDALVPIQQLWRRGYAVAKSETPFSHNLADLAHEAYQRGWLTGHTDDAGESKTTRVVQNIEVGFTAGAIVLQINFQNVNLQTKEATGDLLQIKVPCEAVGGLVEAMQQSEAWGRSEAPPEPSA